MKTRSRCKDRTENELRARGYRFIAGTDEVGRGSLFGAVVAAAVILSPDSRIRGLNDSKQIEAEEREDLAAQIRERAVAWQVAAVDACRIDRINIYQASRLAMRTAVMNLSPAPDFVLVDAVPLEIPMAQQALIKGDERCHAIAAASIIAKVHRDALMKDWDAVYPEYGLGSGKGYMTPEHQEALQRIGPTPLHRFSFEPVRLAAFQSPMAADRQMAMFA